MKSRILVSSVCMATAMASPNVASAIDGTMVPDDAFVWQGTDGTDFNTPANWKCGEIVRTVAPDADMMGAFTSVGGEVTLGADTSASYLWVQKGISFDLGGKTLAVVNDLYLCTLTSFDSQRYVFTNGVVNCGGTLRMNFGKSGADFAWFYGSAKVIGPDTQMNVTGATYAYGKGVSFDVSGGASFNANGAVYVSSKGSVSDGTGAAFKISGEGTKANFNQGFSVGLDAGASTLEVCDGAVLNVSGKTSLRFGDRNCIGRSYSGNSLLVDNATVNYGVSEAYNLNIGDADNTAITGRNSLIVTNNAVFNVLANKDICCGVSIGQYATISNGSIEVYDGGTISSLGGILLGVGQTKPCGGHLLNVDDGVVSVSVLQTGNKAGDSNSVVRVAGHRGKILLSSASNPCRLNSSVKLRFKIPADGFADVPLQAPNGKVLTTVAGTDPISLEIDDGDFGLHHGSTKVTLVSAGADSTAAYQELIDNFTHIGPKADAPAGVLSIENGGKDLCYTTPPRPGLMLILR